MTGRIIVLNGGSSSGKTDIARNVQIAMPEVWLGLSVDTLIHALPPKSNESPRGIDVDANGSISLGPEFFAAERAWRYGVATLAHAGANVIIDDVFLRGAQSQHPWERALEGLSVLWVGVVCSAQVAQERELARGDRVQGMAALQAEAVHRGVRYDLTVNTEIASARECAALIVAAHVNKRG